MGGGTSGGSGAANSNTPGTGGGATGGASFGSGASARGGGRAGGASGGGGWYGGTASANGSNSHTGGGGGGSGYVYTSLTANQYPSGCLLNPSFYLTDASTTPNLNTGNGKAKITLVK